MIEGTNGSRDRAAWAARRWWWLVAAIVVAVTVGVAGRDEERDHEAAALVVARELAIEPDQLPGYLRSVFDSGALRLRIAETADVDPNAAIPDVVRLEPVAGTIAARIVARGDDAASAATLANVAARAYVVELNKPGPGVGDFDVQDLARPSGASVTGGSSTLTALAAGGAALVVAVAAVALWTAWRRPVTSAALASRAVGAAVVGELELPIEWGDFVEPRRVVGLDALARRLVPGPGTTVLVGAPADRSDVDRLAVLIARVSSRRLPTEALLVHDEAVPTAQAPAGGAVTVAVTGVVDVPQVVPTGARLVLVVVAGTREADLLLTRAPFAADDLDGIVFMHRPSWLAQRLAAPTRRAPTDERVGGELAPSGVPSDDGVLSA